MPLQSIYNSWAKNQFYFLNKIRGNAYYGFRKETTEYISPSVYGLQTYDGRCCFITILKFMQSIKNYPDNAVQPRRGTIDAQSALSILRDFYTECRKEIRKLTKVKISLATDDEICSLHFIADGFDLNMIIKEGGAS